MPADTRKPAFATITSRLSRRRLAALGSAAAIGGIALTAATPAHADTYTQTCSSYGLYTVCVSYDYTNSFVAANFYNGTGSSKYVTLWLVDGSVSQSQSDQLAAKTWTGFGFYDTNRSTKPCATGIVGNTSYGVCLNG